jgi:membrane associated rhomboid family serine protease
MDVIPPVVKNLLIINAIVFLATSVLENQGIDLNEYFALYHWSSEKFGIWQFVTHIFMHANFMHLFSNMFALWMFGAILENHFGPKRFLSFYLMCGIGAAVFHLGVYSYELGVIKDAVAQFQLNPTYKSFSSFLSQNHISIYDNYGQQLYNLKSMWVDNPMDDSFARTASTLAGKYQLDYINQGTVGASGAVFGILFAFGYLFPNMLIYMYFFFPLKAKYFVAIYALFELYAGVNQTAGDNVAHFAHLGGMLIAFIIIKIWNKTNRKHFY